MFRVHISNDITFATLVESSRYRGQIYTNLIMETMAVGDMDNVLCSDSYIYIL